MYRNLSRAGLCVLFAACLLLPCLRCTNMLCHYCPLQSINKTCRGVLSECPPQELCFKAEARYGDYVALTARGCITREYCRLENNIVFKGTKYTLSYSCCDWDYCNSGSHRTVYTGPLTVVAAAILLLLTTYW